MLPLVWTLLASLLSAQPLGPGCDLRPEEPIGPAERWSSFTCAGASGAVWFGEDGEALGHWEDLGFREGVVRDRADDRPHIGGQDLRRARATVVVEGQDARALTLVAGERWLLSCVSDPDAAGWEACEAVVDHAARRWRRLRRRSR